MEIIGESVDCINRNSIPEEGEDCTELGINPKDIRHLSIYKRSKEACPFARGNWLCDIRFIDNTILCIKLPLNMTDNAVLKFFDPIIEYLENQKKTKSH